MNVKEKKLKKDLIDATRAVKKKFQELHSDKILLDEHLEEKYKPITKSLRTIIENQKIDEPFINIQKLNKKYEDSDDYNDDISSNNDSYGDQNDNFVDAKDGVDETPKSVKSGNPKKINFEQKPANDEHLTDDDDDVVVENQINWSKYYDVLLSKASDTQFGVRRSNNSLKIGKYVIKFHKDHLRIRSEKFPVTTGLLDLLFYKRPPSGYTTDDLPHYKSILLLTDAHKKYFEENTSVRNSKKNFKYKNIISPILKSGSGIETDFMTVNNNTSVDYTYWDDPNELVERLRLLVSSSSAGHTGHNNEIISIIEELREANIIH